MLAGAVPMFCPFCKGAKVEGYRSSWPHPPHCCVQIIDILGLCSALQEAEVDEDGEAVRIADWDKSAADAAYKEQVERANQAQKEWEAQQQRLFALRGQQVGLLWSDCCLGSRSAWHCSVLPCKTRG